MNKFIILFLLFAMPIFAQQSAELSETKKIKLEQLSDIFQDKKLITKIYDPLFTNANISDEKTKESIMSKFFEDLKKDFVVVYDKAFSEKNIDDLLNFFTSETGKKYISISPELSVELAKSHQKILSLINEKAAPKSTTAKEEVKKSDAVKHFSEIVKDKTDTEVRELFKKEIEHDGLTVVKFSAEWCGPCKAYAPTFEQIAEKTKEAKIAGKNVNVKFIDIDIDNAKVVAQDNSVMSVPTTIFYKNGKKVDTKIGFLQKSNLENCIERLAK